MQLRLGLVAALVLLVCLAPSRTGAHGVWGHVHVTEWAIESLPPGPLKDFFADPEVREAALFGAAFPDTGYWTTAPEAREYAEYSHWEPFIQAFVEYARTNVGPPFDSVDDRRLIAFLMGCGAHGLQDEIFDSLFLFQVEQRDGGNQGDADGGTDFFLVDDGILPYDLPEFVPMSVLLPLYADIPFEITEDVIRQGVEALRSAYLNEATGTAIAEGLLQENAERIPWTRENYLDPKIPGSLLSEIEPTQSYMEAIWHRLHGEGAAAPLVIHRYPEDGTRLRSGEPLVADSFATLVFGQGIDIGSARGSYSGRGGRAVDFRFDGTRWGHPWPRLVRFQPNEVLPAGSRYTVALEPGTVRIDGTVEPRASDLTFRVAGGPTCGPARLATSGVGTSRRAQTRCSRPSRLGVR